MRTKITGAKVTNTLINGVGPKYVPKNINGTYLNKSEKENAKET